eukprot:4717145-Karenia_brevis.AAC.1
MAESQEPANTAWALAKAGHASPGFFDATAEAAKVCFKDIKLQHLVHTVREFATASHASQGAFDAMAEFHEMANTAWALAKASHASPGFFDAIAEAAKVRFKDVKCQHFLNIMR